MVPNCSVVDTDGSTLIWLSWIQIRIGQYYGSGYVGCKSFWACLPNSKPLSPRCESSSVSGSFPSSSRNSEKNLYFFCFVTYLWLFVFKEWCKCSFKNILHLVIIAKNFEQYIFVVILKVTDGRSRIQSQRYGSDPNQNVTDPEHWYWESGPDLDPEARKLIINKKNPIFSISKGYCAYVGVF